MRGVFDRFDVLSYLLQHLLHRQVTLQVARVLNMSEQELCARDLTDAILARRSQRFLGRHAIRSHIYVDVVAGEMVQNLVPPRFIGGLMKLPRQPLIVRRLSVPESVSKKIGQVGIPL